MTHLLQDVNRSVIQTRSDVHVKSDVNAPFLANWSILFPLMDCVILANVNQVRRVTIVGKVKQGVLKSVGSKICSENASSTIFSIEN